MTRRIAIVEDEAAIRENYAAAFRREGYAVDAYDARRPAMAAFESRLPDLVVIDVNLKNDVEGGFELCRELRSRASELPTQPKVSRVSMPARRARSDHNWFTAASYVSETPLSPHSRDTLMPAAPPEDGGGCPRPRPNAGRRRSGRCR